MQLQGSRSMASFTLPLNLNEIESVFPDSKPKPRNNHQHSPLSIMEEGWDFESSPPSFKQVQPLLLALFSLSGTGWLINYITTIRTAYRDRTTGVSLVALTNNLAWELVFAILHPPPLPVAKVILRSWLFVDIFVIYTTAKFARASSISSNAPLLHRYLHFFVLFGVLGFFSGHWALSVLLSPIKAFYWSGMMCLVTMSGTALGILVQRGHTRGMSYGMWCVPIVYYG